MTAASGAPSLTNGSSGSPSLPTGPQIASASSDPSAAAGEKSAAAGAARSTRPRRSRAGNPARRLFRFDRSLGVRYVAGADEAGRGCLAGPLVAAAVLFDLERIGPREVRALSGLNDSKQQLPERRAEVFPVILRTAARVVILSRCAPGIDSRGLHITNLAALHEALRRVAYPGCICLSDGFPVARLPHDQLAVIGGDAKSASIAAASVIAKETRD